MSERPFTATRGSYSAGVESDIDAERARWGAHKSGFVSILIYEDCAAPVFEDASAEARSYDYFS
jgi:hypothetical protein